MSKWFVCSCTTGTLTIISAVFVAGCELPRDPDHTLDDSYGSVIRVGLLGTDEQNRQEREVLAKIAEDRHSTLKYESSETHDLVQKLKDGDIELIVSLPKKTPFSKEIGLTRWYHNATWPDAERVWAVRSGENAWLLFANRRLSVLEERQ